MSKKKNLGQFYTTRAEYIIKDLLSDLPKNVPVIEPFCGKGDLLIFDNEWEGYDIDPQFEGCIQRDTLRNPPEYKGKLVITNPPYLARNKNSDKDIYDLYKVGDLYKASILSILDCSGGILVIPLNFFCDEDSLTRTAFFNKFKVINLKVFEETVFDDTAYTICAFSFLPRENEPVEIKTVFLPSKEKMSFRVGPETGYRIGSDFFELIEKSKDLGIGRLSEGQESNSHLYLRAIDTGSEDGRISLSINEVPYYGKKSDRVFASIKTRERYTIEDQRKIAQEFNTILEKYRKKYHSMFLTNYRNSSSTYARKRISFDVAYKLIEHIIEKEKISPMVSERALW